PLLGQGNHQRDDRLRRPPRGNRGNRHGNGRLPRADMMGLFPADIEETAARVLTHYRERRMMLSTAESCTGGLIAGALTEIAGSSAVVDRGFVTYTNEAKMELIGVSPATLEAFGAVSKETALQMAHGALYRSRADVSVAVTGVAGPGGGSAEKPV